MTTAVEIFWRQGMASLHVDLGGPVVRKRRDCQLIRAGWG